MAIVIQGKTTCSVCGAILSEGDDIVLFPHFIWDEAHPLWRFSDSGMHRSCFTSWDHAEQFRAMFSKAWPKLVPNHPREIRPDGSIVELGGDATAPR